MNPVTLRARLKFMPTSGGVSGPALVDILFEEPRPLKPPRPFVHQFRLQAQIGSHHLLPWIDRLMDEAGWSAAHVRTARAMMSPGARTVSRSSKFCKACRTYVALQASGCAECKSGTQRGVGQFDSDGKVRRPSDFPLHRVFALPRQQSEEDLHKYGPAVRYVDVLEADVREPVYLIVHGDDEVARLCTRLAARRDDKHPEVVASYQEALPLLARNVASDESLAGLTDAMAHWATVTVEDVSMDLEPSQGEDPPEEGDHLIVTDDLVPATGFDWRSLAGATEHVTRCLECYGLEHDARHVEVNDTDAETAYIPVGAARLVQPFIERGSTLRISLKGDASWRQKAVTHIAKEGMRIDSRGVGMAVSIYPVSACEGLKLATPPVQR